MDHDVSCRVIIPIFKFINKRGIRIEQIISGLSVDKRYIENPKNWISRDLAVAIFEHCEKIFDDPFVMYKIGMEHWSKQEGAYSAFIRLLLTPSFVVKFLPRINSLQSKFFKMQAERVGKNQLRVRFTYSDNKMAHRHGCMLNLGLTASFPKYVWKAESEIVEEECVCSCELESITRLDEKPKMVRSVKFGSTSCVYLLKWDKSKTGHHTAAFLDSNQGLIEETIHELLKAESHVSPKLTNPELEYFGSKLSELNFISPRETQIIKLVIQGEKNKKIAEKLYISEETVKKHLNNIFKKMRVNSRSELIAKIYNFKTQGL